MREIFVRKRNLSTNLICILSMIEVLSWLSKIVLIFEGPDKIKYFYYFVYENKINFRPIKK